MNLSKLWETVKDREAWRAAVYCKDSYRDFPGSPLAKDFPGGSDGKDSTCNSRELGLIPGLGRSPG